MLQVLGDSSIISDSVFNEQNFYFSCQITYGGTNLTISVSLSYLCWIYT